MKYSIQEDIAEKLIPVLSTKEKQDILNYFSVYEKYAEEFSERAIEDLKHHPVFGKLITDMPEEVAAERNRRSRMLQKDAIENDNWLPYIEYQIEQGIIYAKMGLDFKSWFEVVSLVRHYLLPYLHDEYGHGPQFLSALSGMNLFMDIAMSVIGEAYLQEKKAIIKSANERLTSIFETTADVIFVLEVEQNERFKFVTVNKSFQTTTGISTEMVVGKYVNEIIPQHSLELSLEKYKEAIHSKSIVRWEETVQYPTGLLTGEVSIAPHFDETGNCTLLVGAIHDVTDRKKAEIEIKTLNEKLEQKVIERTAQLESVNKELEAFTYSVSHDLRAPLRAISGYAEMFIEDYGHRFDKEEQRIMDNISYQAVKMGTLIDDLLTFSRLGRKEVQMTKIEMNELTNGVLNELNKSTHHSAKINIGNLHEIHGDYGLIHQVMLNLVSNAIKYSSKKNNPYVEISSTEDNGEIIFSIKDNGAGFDMEYADKLFGVFQRLHSQEEFEGTGVGLAIVHRLITKHGGKIWAEGKVNEGATFKFSLKHITT